MFVGGWRSVKMPSFGFGSGRSDIRRDHACRAAPAGAPRFLCRPGPMRRSREGTRSRRGRRSRRRRRGMSQRRRPPANETPGPCGRVGSIPYLSVMELAAVHLSKECLLMVFPKTVITSCGRLLRNYKLRKLRNVLKHCSTSMCSSFYSDGP